MIRVICDCGRELQLLERWPGGSTHLRCIACRRDCIVSMQSPQAVAPAWRFGPYAPLIRSIMAADEYYDLSPNAREAV